jgi:hypothetical protein
MPKISVHGGASNKYEPPPAPPPARVAVAGPFKATHIVGEHGPELFPDADPPPTMLATVVDDSADVAEDELVAVVLAAIEEPATEEPAPADGDA